MVAMLGHEQSDVASLAMLFSSDCIIINGQHQPQKSKSD